MTEIYTLVEAAAKLKMHPVTLRNLARAGVIVGVKDRSKAKAHWKFAEEALLLYIRQNS